MSENINDLPKKDPRRNRVAEQIAKARQSDRDLSYENNRNARGYLEELQGLRQFFNYVKKLPVHKVLDIGAGLTRGITELSKEPMGKGLEFEATILSHPSFSIQDSLGEDKIHITSAEVLRGVEDSSIGGVLSVFSIAYSKEPALAVAGIDRVLVPSGIFKGRFRRKTDEEYSVPPYFSAKFLEAFHNLGYDVALDDQREAKVLTAIKPPTALGAAKKLMRADSNSLYEQITSVPDTDVDPRRL